MPRLFVPLTRDEFDRLQRQAFEDRRRPRDQAAFLIAKALGRVDEANRANMPEIADATR
jgi:hypothetical protein